MPSETSKHTLYRLTVPPPADSTGLMDAIDLDRVDELDGTYNAAPSFTELGIPSFYASCQYPPEEASWCSEFQRTTGASDISVLTNRSAAVLVLAIDGQVYAVGYDQGFHLIRDEVKDGSFGLTFALRAIDPSVVSGITSKVFGQGRTDNTLVPNGTSVHRITPDNSLRIVRKMAGALNDVELTTTKLRKARIAKAAGGIGLNVALGIAPEKMLSDIQEITQVCRERRPHEDLQFIDQVKPVQDPSTRELLEQELDEMLGDRENERICAAVPNTDKNIAEARHFRIKINSDEWAERTDFDLEHVRARASQQRRGQRLPALRNGRVALHRSANSRSNDDRIGEIKAVRWLEADVSLGSERFCFMDDEWFEIGAQYRDTIARTLQRTITTTPSVRLPRWLQGEHEQDYNLRAPRDCPEEGYVCLDQRNVPNPLKKKDSLEICDLLTQDGTMVLVKHAKKSDSLSHLFEQGLVAAEALQSSAESRRAFAERVAERASREVIGEDFTPKRMVFAILLAQGRALTPDSLFAFSQATLTNAVTRLDSRNIQVEAVGIEREQPAEAGNPVPTTERAARVCRGSARREPPGPGARSSMAPRPR